MPAQAAEFQLLSETLAYWSIYEPAVKCEIGCAAIKVGRGWVVIDPVSLNQTAWEELLGGDSLLAILITNGNHERDAAALRQRHRIPIVTAAETRRDLGDLKPDVTLLPNEMIYGIRAIPIPGATNGETAFYSKSGELVLGDAVIQVSSEAGLEFLPDKYCVDAKQNRASLRQLLDLSFHTLILAHGAPVVERAKEKLAALLSSS